MEMLLAAGEPATGIEGMLMSYGPLLLMFVVLYLLLIRPQQKRQKQRNLMLGNLKKGDKVVTIGGMIGTIVEITDDTVLLRINETNLSFERFAINAVKSSAQAE